MLEPYFPKQPFQMLELPVDWGVRWPDAFPTITSGVVVVYERILDATGALVDLLDVTSQMAPNPTLAVFGKVTSVLITGGLSGHEYALAYRIQLSDGQADEQDRIIKVQEEH